MAGTNHTHKGDIRKTARRAYMGLKKKHHKATNHTHKGDIRKTARRAYMGLKKKHHKATNHTHKGDIRKTARRAYMGLKKKHHKKSHKKHHKKHHKKSHKKRIYLKARGLNRPGLSLAILDVTKKNNDGEVASSPVQKLLPGLPITPPDGKYGDGVLARQKWMNKQDNDAFLEAAETLGLRQVENLKPKNFRTPSLTKSQTNRYMNLVAKLNSLKPSSTWRTVNRKKK